MADNKVQIQITAEDLASSIISTINTHLGGIADTAKGATDGLSQTGQTGVRSLESLLPPLQQIPLLFNQTLMMLQSFAAGLMSLAQTDLSRSELFKILSKLKSRVIEFHSVIGYSG